VQWNGSPRPTTYVSSTQLSVTLSASDLATAGVVQVTVVNPGAGTSVAFTFTINNPVPEIASVSPATVLVNTNTLVSVNGTGFLATSVARWNGVPHATAFRSSSVLQVTLPAADLAAPGSGNITVSNSGPGGGESAPAPVAIEYAVPFVANVSPDSALAGAPATDITIAGSGFAPASVVQWNGSPITTQYVSAGQLRASIPAAKLASSGRANVTVQNPAPGGGTSAPVTFNVYAAANISSVAPTTVMVHSPDTDIWVSGTGFLTVN
jgi:hypothetical protein